MTNDRPERLGRLTVAAHWIVALLVIATVPLGLYFSDLPRGALQTRLFTIHIAIGLLILAVALPRLVVRLFRPLPAIPGGHAPWETRLARAVHWGLLILTAAMPLGGILIVMSTGGGLAVGPVTLLPGTGVKVGWLHEAAETLHWLGGWAIIGLFALHFSGAMKHAFVDRDGTVRRMLGKTV